MAVFPSKWSTTCRECSAAIKGGRMEQGVAVRGDNVEWLRGVKGVRCMDCYNGVKRAPTESTNLPLPTPEPTAKEIGAESAKEVVKQAAEIDRNMLAVEIANQLTPVLRSVAATVEQVSKKSQEVFEFSVSAIDDSRKAGYEGAQKAIKEHIENTRIIEIRVPDKEPKKITGAHFLFERLVRLVGAGVHVHLWGPAGTGKTTAALQVAEALSRFAEIDTLDRSTFRSMVQGFMSPNGDKVHTSFTRCWTEGKIYVADECDNAPGAVQTLFNSALANNMASLAWGNEQMAKGFGFVSCGNTPFRPTRNFPDRLPGSGAFMDRLYFMYWPLDRSIMRSYANLPRQAAPRREYWKVSPESWERWIEGVMDYCERAVPTLAVTPRAAIVGIKALSLGESPEEVADALVFRGADSDMRSKVLSNVPLPRS